jgi:hypothetical protein
MIGYIFVVLLGIAVHLLYLGIQVEKLKQELKDLKYERLKKAAGC